MKTCLIADDSGVVRKVARNIMEELGFAVQESVNGEDALRSCDHAMPDVILLDWSMPVVDGLEFLERLRARPDGAEAKVIFCTAMNDVAHISRAIEAGADEYIMKPFDADILREKLDSVGFPVGAS